MDEECLPRIPEKLLRPGGTRASASYYQNEMEIMWESEEVRVPRPIQVTLTVQNLVNLSISI